MKALLLISTLFIVAFATSKDPLCPAATKCNRNPDIKVKCTTDPPRVLGVTNTKCYDIFANSCVACYAENDVIKWYELTACPVWKKAPNCAEYDSDPVCAYNKETNKLKRYPNFCYACVSTEVDYYIKGKCPKLTGYCKQGGSGIDY